MPTSAVIILVVAFLAGEQAGARTQREAPPAPAGRDTLLARGWSAMAAGRYRDADRAADDVLRRTAWDHAAIVLKISALARMKALGALDAYETWLGAGRSEDAGLLEPVARATLAELASDADRAVAVAALEQLARHGEGDARRQIAAAAASGSAAAEVALARLGDAAAITRLQTAAAASGGGANSPGDLAETLADIGPSSVPSLLVLLEKGRGPDRAAAAMALGRLHASSAIDALRRAAAEPEPLLSTSAAVSLARLGDADARTRVEGLLSIEIADVRLLAAEAWEGRPGPWVDAVRSLLHDPAGLVRLQAARLIAPVDPEAASAALGAGMQDENPVVRGAAAGAVADLADEGVLVVSLESLRLMLRDGQAINRLSAAAALLSHIRKPR